jgi:hypothetical protein
MRSRTSSLVFVFCLAAGAAFTACSGETTENPGGGGGSGASGSAGTTSSTTGASTSSTTAATSSGAGGDDGGGDVCDQACSRATECGSAICEQFPIDCSNPQYECIAQCVLDAEQCDDLATTNLAFVACVSTCAGEQGAGGGNNGADCRACAFTSGCLTSCLGNPGCQQWLVCTQICFTGDPQPECFRSCDTAAAADGEEVVALYRAAYECTCTSCADTCEAVADPCSP